VTETCYELRVAGRMSERACSAFMDMTVLPVAPETILYGRLTDAQLHGLLALCQDLGLQVVAIREAPSAAIAASGQHGPHGEQQHDRGHCAVASQNPPRRD
jgi:hypothetical protein